MSEPRRAGRAPAEWVTFGLSVAVLAFVAAVLVVGGDDDPAWPVASVTKVVTAPDGGTKVVVEVDNEGGRAAAAVQVTATLTVDGTEETGDQTIDFLGAGEQRTVVFLFAATAADGELDVAVTSFAVP